MNIVYCRCCANELPDTAPTCSKCGAAQARVARAAAAAGQAAQSSKLFTAPPPATRSIGRWLLTIVVTGISIVMITLLWPAIDALR